VAADCNSWRRFTKPVFLRTLKGERIDVWVRKDRQPGRHFADQGTDPGTLGMDLTGRERLTYEVDADTEALETTSARAK
jgi:hypothetical protein